MKDSQESGQQENTKDSGRDHAPWHVVELDKIRSLFDTDFDKGLSEERIKELRKRYGKNELEKKSGPGLLGKFFKQFKNPLVIILLVAGATTLAIGYFHDPHVYLDAIVIFIALFVNVTIGVFQEERASKAFEKLSESQERETLVIRDGDKHMIPATEVVAGDIIELEAGMYVPADIRIIEESDLEINESALTGEWASVAKDVEEDIGEDTPVAERSNMAWKGTVVSSGEARGVVVATGEDTELGRIAEHLTGEDEGETPIQRNMARLAAFLSWVTLALVVLIIGLGVFRGEPLVEILLVAIAIAVSVVPEGLPAAVTVVLAIGMEKILDRGGLVRNLTAAETLGSTTVILTDKTGTLTQAKMRVQNLITLDHLNEGEEQKIGSDTNLDSTQRTLLKGATLITDAFIEEAEDAPEKLTVHGSPMEKAIVVSGLEHGISKQDMADSDTRLDFLSFSSENRFAASLNKQEEGSNILYFSGAPETLLENAEYVLEGGERTELTEEKKKIFTKKLDEKTGQGYRIIATGFKEFDGDEIPMEAENEMTKEAQTGIVFSGLLVFADPLREDVAEEIEKAKQAGTHVVMLTGDNPKTALTIAQQAGIADENTEPITGPELEGMSDEELAEAMRTRTVFARVLPAQKYRISKVLRARDEVVAMTGDGVNDAPALRSADIGVAVGSGTEVAKEASDLVLLDDSFSIIVAAIEEGRRIIDNLKKIVTELIATSFGEVFLIAGALIAASPLPILPAQILWVNIIEGAIMTFAFAFEPAEEGIMKRNPRDTNTKRLLSTRVKQLIFTSGIATGIFLLILYFWMQSIGVPIDEIRTVMLAALSFDAIFFAISLKNFEKPLWKIDLFSNKVLIASLGISIVFLIGALTLPILMRLLKTVPITGVQGIVLLGVGIFDVLVIELSKYFLFERKRKRSES